jgi:hypothetical protein
LVELADDNDRWLHRLQDSHALALAVGVLGAESFAELLQFAQLGSWGDRLREAHTRALSEIEQSVALADASRCERRLSQLGVTLVTAVCDGYPSEVADRWNATARESVFAFFDLRSRTVSFRRSPDCEVDLSQVARRLGGGGHPAASGCELPDLLRQLAWNLAERVESAIDQPK